MPTVRLLAISGSLRAKSSNGSLLLAARALAPEGMEVVLYGGLGELPLFNPDLDEDPGPPAVVDLRERIRSADGVVISSPEYAHSVPGAMKNALDWLVGSGELVEKPVALWNASPTSTFAHAALLEILGVMSARLLPEASIAVPLRRGMDESEIAADPEIAEPIRKALDEFAAQLGSGTTRSLTVP
ncbi:MAG TPA: NADPH-dependent FMN reductase [Thermoanaerobaculia bacterium]|jgi:NAD(P)H-dependent FMN reductase|nr:NADPH-dependent FMN reductase [Thermoanaerobaculia bacterium]